MSKRSKLGGEGIQYTCKFRENIDIVDTQSFNASMSFFIATSHQNHHPHRNHWNHWNHHDNRNHCDDCNHLNPQVQAANTGPAKYKGLTDVVFSLYRFAPFKFLSHLILCIIVVSIMTTTNVSSLYHHHHHHHHHHSSSSPWPPPCPPEIKIL